MWKKWTAIALLAALLLAGCGGGVNQPPGDQLSAAEDSVNAQAATLLNDAIAAFSDVLPAGLAPQATGTEPPPLTLAYNGEETVLIGAPWRPPFPWPLPNGADDLDGKPLFIAFSIKTYNALIKTPLGPRPPKAHVGRLQRNARGEWEVAWFSDRGAPPEIRPATVEQVGRFRDTAEAKTITKTSIRLWPPPVEVDILFIKCRLCNAEDISSSPRIHVRAPLPQNLQGREINSSAHPDMQGFVNKLKDICCGIPKPFPPDWPPLILFRNDVSVVFVPYDNPKVREAQSLDDLIGQDIGFGYVRKKPFKKHDGSVRIDHRLNENNLLFRFVKPGNPSQVVATLPAEVAVEPSDGREIGIMDSIDSPNEPVLQMKWPKIKIKVRLISEMQR
jgi:outer membrane murein-binding lipoprotein Lpp